jgi:hypothetical protein
MDYATRREIDRLASKVLKDARLIEPPLQIEEILEHLRLHRKFYDLRDPSLLQRFTHKLRIGGQRIIGIVRKIKLAAIWAPDRSEILIDESQPAPKQVWAAFHDATHGILPWHRDFFLGDTAQTLEPYYQDILEEEANYGASALMFGPRFTEQAKDLEFGWSAIEELKRTHKKSYVTVLRRYVEHGPNYPLAGVISTAHWDLKPEDQLSRCRHFVRSPEFAMLFPSVTSEDLRQLIDSKTHRHRGGPVGRFEITFSPCSPPTKNTAVVNLVSARPRMSALLAVLQRSLRRVIQTNLGPRIGAAAGRYAVRFERSSWTREWRDWSRRQALRCHRKCTSRLGSLHSLTARDSSRSIPGKCGAPFSSSTFFETR